MTLYRDDEFLFKVPLWFLVNPSAAESEMSMRGVLRGQNDDLGEYPLLFTEEDLAVLIRDSRKETARYLTATLKTNAGALEFIDAAEKWGCNYVALDYSFKTAAFSPIQEFRKAVAR